MSVRCTRSRPILTLVETPVKRRLPLEIGQFYSVYVQWTWNDEKKAYQQEELDWDGDTPFCDACETGDWDFTDNDLIV